MSPASADMAESLRDFDRSLPMSLMKAREAVMKEFIPSLREHNLTPQQWRVIRSLQQHDGQDMGSLADSCFLLSPSLSRIVQTLEGRGLVSRRGVRGDQRRQAVFLSTAGRKLFALIAPKSAERYQRITEKFGYGKLELLYELLDDLVASLDHPE